MIRKLICVSFLVFIVNSCSRQARLLPGNSFISDRFMMCYDRKMNIGVCYKEVEYFEENDSVDNWCFLIKNTIEYKYDSVWFIAKNKYYYLVAQHGSPPKFMRKFKKNHYSSFVKCLYELNVPDSLHIRPIE